MKPKQASNESESAAITYSYPKTTATHVRLLMTSWYSVDYSLLIYRQMHTKGVWSPRDIILCRFVSSYLVLPRLVFTVQTAVRLLRSLILRMKS